MTTTSKDKNSSTESVVSLSYSEAVSFEEFEQTVDEFDKPTDVTRETYESTVEVEDKLVEFYESSQESETSETVNLSIETMESADNIEELKHFTSPTPIQPGIASYNSDNNSSWSDAIEAFLDQLNDIDFDSDYERDILLKRGLNEPGEINIDDQDIEDTEEKVINELRTGQGFLLCLAVPVLISQILMLLILTSTTSNAKSNIIVSPIGQIQAIHHHHYYYYHHHYEPKGKSENGFAYVFFNPLGAIYNSRYFKITAAWISKEYRKQLNDPSSFISQLSHYISLYLNSIKSRVLKLNNVMKSGLDNEIGKALRIRDKWNRAVFDKIYKIASTPQYQRVVSTVSKWASAIKDRLFS